MVMKYQMKRKDGDSYRQAGREGSWKILQMENKGLCSNPRRICLLLSCTDLEGRLVILEQCFGVLRCISSCPIETMIHVGLAQDRGHQSVSRTQKHIILQANDPPLFIQAGTRKVPANCLWSLKRCSITLFLPS